MYRIDSPLADKYLDILRERLGDHTIKHCVFTANYMNSYADQAGITSEQAITSGLLHDLYKEADDEATLDAAAKYAIEPSEAQRKHPKLLHGPVAAEECRRDLGIDDDLVIEAIYWHTTGRPGLGPVGLALYFADFAEPSRHHEAAAQAREVLQNEGFKKALLFASHKKLEHILTKRHIDPITLEFHRWLKVACNE